MRGRRPKSARGARRPRGCARRGARGRRGEKAIFFSEDRERQAGGGGEESELRQTAFVEERERAAFSRRAEFLPFSLPGQYTSGRGASEGINSGKGQGSNGGFAERKEVSIEGSDGSEFFPSFSLAGGRSPSLFADL